MTEWNDTNDVLDVRALVGDGEEGETLRETVERVIEARAFEAQATIADERDDLQVQYEESEAALLRLVEEVTRELRAAYMPYTLPSGQRPAELIAHVFGHLRAEHKKTIEAAGAAAAGAQRTIEGLRAERELLRGMIVEGMKS